MHIIYAKGFYDLLPTLSNLARYNCAVEVCCVTLVPRMWVIWLFTTFPVCLPRMLGKNKWRHEVLRVLAEVIRKVVDKVKEFPIKKSPPQPITFVTAGLVISKLKLRKPSQHASCYNLLDWIFQVDFDTALHFLVEVAVTSMRPDIVLWFKATKTVIFCELKDYAEKAYERKKEKFQNLTDTCK